MADAQETVETQTQEAPSAPALPEGHVAVSQADIDRYKRIETQVKGYEPILRSMQSLGFKSGDDLTGLKPLVDLARQRGLSPSQLARALTMDVEPEQESGDFDMKSQFEKEMAEMRRQGALERAQWRHDQELASMKKYLDASSADLLGEDATDLDKYLWNTALQWETEQARRQHTYDDDHPMRNVDWRALSEEQVKELVKGLQDRRAKAAGERAAAKGDLAGKPAPRSTPAGSQPGQGKPQTEPTRKGEGFLGTDPAEVQRAYEARRSARARGPVSSMG